MKRYIDGLGSVMKDQKRFFELPKEIQKSVYDYLNLHRKKRKLEKKKIQLIENYKQEKKSLEREIKSLTRDETKNFQLAINGTYIGIRSGDTGTNTGQVDDIYIYRGILY